MVHFLLAVGHDFYLTWWLLKEPLVLLPVEAMSNSKSESDSTGFFPTECFGGFWLSILKEYPS